MATEIRRSFGFLCAILDRDRSVRTAEAVGDRYTMVLTDMNRGFYVFYCFPSYRESTWHCKSDRVCFTKISQTAPSTARTCSLTHTLNFVRVAAFCASAPSSLQWRPPLCGVLRALVVFRVSTPTDMSLSPPSRERRFFALPQGRVICAHLSDSVYVHENSVCYIACTHCFGDKFRLALFLFLIMIALCLPTFVHCL